MKNATWFVYIVECCDGSLYTGITNQLEKRISAHNSGKGAKYTKSRTPVVLKFFSTCASKSEACKQEIAIKKLSRTDKLALIEKGSKKNKKLFTFES
jgi:putative endonuclease